MQGWSVASKATDRWSHPSVKLKDRAAKKVAVISTATRYANASQRPAAAVITQTRMAAVAMAFR